MKKNNLIVALDLDSFKKAKRFVNILWPKVKIFKVGLQLFINCGPKIIKEIHNKGGEVFLDLKFHDIPNTVANSVRQAVRLKVKMLTVHISGGKEMLVSAVKTAKSEAKKINAKCPLLIGVTVLTSQETSPQKVLALAKFGLACGLDGVVCSAKEAALLRKNIKKKFIIVTPGIRLDKPRTLKIDKKVRGKETKDDQKRTATLDEALKSTSDFLVIGRPILEARNPRRIVEEILH